jgi:hypothetical protein
VKEKKIQAEVQADIPFFIRYPWLPMVKLQPEGEELHIRALFTNDKEPTADLRPDP